MNVVLHLQRTHDFLAQIIEILGKQPKSKTCGQWPNEFMKKNFFKKISSHGKMKKMI